MHRVSLLFTTARKFLGEIVIRDGGCEHVLLNADGESSIGAYIEDWRVRGVPVVRHVARHPAGHVFYQERIPLRSHEFETALEQWGMTHETIALSISDRDIRTWEQMLRLPVEDEERFSMIVIMRVAPEQDRSEWHTSVHAAIRAIDAHDASARKKILALRKKVAADLVKTFERASGSSVSTSS
jgi:hypothetical protein